MESQIDPGAEHAVSFPAFHAIRLRTPQASGDVTFPAGTRGVVVDVYEDGSCDVEFSSPVEDVVIVAGKHLKAA